MCTTLRLCPSRWRDGPQSVRSRCVRFAVTARVDENKARCWCLDKQTETKTMMASHSKAMHCCFGVAPVRVDENQTQSIPHLFPISTRTVTLSNAKYQVACDHSRGLGSHPLSFAVIRVHSRSFALHSGSFAVIRPHSRPFAVIRGHSRSFAVSHSRLFAVIHGHSQSFAVIRAHSRSDTLAQALQILVMS